MPPNINKVRDRLEKWEFMAIKIMPGTGFISKTLTLNDFVVQLKFITFAPRYLIWTQGGVIFQFCAMGNRREYEIAFVGLKPGLHEFNYQIDDRFFKDYQTDFTNCLANIRLSLEKNSSFMMLKFEVGGKVDVVCDRCGNNLTLDLWDEFNMIIKLVENPEEMNNQEEDPDIFYISRTESHLHLSDWLYEFVTLSIPAQRMCKEDEIGGPQCNKEVLEVLKKMGSVNSENNPLAKELEKLKKNIN